MSGAPDPAAARAFLAEFQARAAAAFEAFEPAARFRRDPWTRDGVGRGETRVLEDGETFEKAGANFSDVRGAALPPAASARHPELAGREFTAAGVSIVCHPRNPYAPTAHCNLRFFTAAGAAGGAGGAADGVWWFGGGFDLTPYYGFEEDARGWHAAARAACAPFGDGVYARFKAACDEYFYLPHRGETRGVGGLFFDDLNEWGFARTLDFARAAADAFLAAYGEIVERRRETPYGARERAWQKHRRGRYAEFNLLYDRGTLFGLQHGGRAESILMSLPPECGWGYGVRPEPGSPEAALAAEFLGARDW